jgi:hypothetical protein
MNNKTNITSTAAMLAIFVALGVVLVAGLIAIPALDQAYASNATSDSKKNGQQGTESSDGKRQGRGGGNGGGGHHRP